MTINSDLQKVCKNCGIIFNRKIQADGGLLTITLWRRAVYCSRKCCSMCPEHQEKMRSAAIKRGFGKHQKGKKLSAETREKIRQSQIGHSRGGWKLSEEARMNQSISRRGEKSSFWRGGITSANVLARSGIDYRKWRDHVFQRDDYTCVVCGMRGGRLHADHIMPFSLFPSLRFEISNGRTLCVDCHKKTPSYLKGRKQLEEMYAGGIDETPSI